MRTRTLRAALAAAVLAGATAAAGYAATGSASAAVTPVTLPVSARHSIAKLASIGQLVVDGVHEHLLVSDPTSGKIVALGYDGSAAGTIGDVPGVAGLLLSADSATLYAAVADDGVIVAYDTATLTETARYTIGNKVSRLAITAGKLWYSAGLGSGEIGSVDLADGTVTRSLQADAGLRLSGSSLLAVSAAHPGVLAVTPQGDTSAGIWLLDVTGDTPTVIAHRDFDYDHLTYPTGLEYSADGSQVVAGGTGGFWYSSATDLSDQGGVAVYRGNFFDITGGGGLAFADQTTATAPDLYLYPAGSSTPSHEWDYPYTTDAPQIDALAWEPGGHHLFAITNFTLGQLSLWVLDEPAKTDTQITLTAPATATRAAALTVSGTITGGVPAGAALTVTRTDAETPAGTALPAVKTAADGTFKLVDSPPAGGTVGYAIGYAGDATHRASSGTVSVTVAKTTPALTISPAGTVYAYGTTVTVTAHLGSGYTNHTVEIQTDPAGADWVNGPAKRGVVDAKGNLTVRLQLSRNTTLHAVYTGDTRFASRTVTSTVATHVAVTTAVAKQYKTTSYYYFHKTANPRFTTTMTEQPSRKQKLVFDYYSGGKWRTWRSYLLTLDKAGHSTYTVTGAHQTGVKYRVRAAYLPGTSGDSLNTTTYGPYRYFTFTK